MTAEEMAVMVAHLEKLRDDLQRLEAQVPAAKHKPLSVGRVESIKRAQEARRLYSNEEKDAWQALAALPDLAGHTKRSKAMLIAKRQGLPAAAARTIRRHL